MLLWTLPHVNRYEVLVGQPLLAVRASLGGEKADSQEWLSYKICNFPLMIQRRINWFNRKRVECISVPSGGLTMKRLVASFFVMGAISFAAWSANKAITFAQDADRKSTRLNSSHMS